VFPHVLWADEFLNTRTALHRELGLADRRRLHDATFVMPHRRLAAAQFSARFGARIAARKISILESRQLAITPVIFAVEKPVAACGPLRYWSASQPRVPYKDGRRIFR